MNQASYWAKSTNVTLQTAGIVIGLFGQVHSQAQFLKFKFWPPLSPLFIFNELASECASARFSALLCSP
jgi:hypothetical protein